MNFLFLCNHGNVRSAAHARAVKDLNGSCRGTDEEYLKEYIKHEAIAIGAHCMSIDTIKLLSVWADVVVDLSDNDERVQMRLKKIAGLKYERIDIGVDRWHDPFAPELRNMANKNVKRLLRDSE